MMVVRRGQCWRGMMSVVVVAFAVAMLGCGGQAQVAAPAVQTAASPAAASETVSAAPLELPEETLLALAAATPAVVDDAKPLPAPDASAPPATSEIESSPLEAGPPAAVSEPEPAPIPATDSTVAQAPDEEPALAQPSDNPAPAEEPADKPAKSKAARPKGDKPPLKQANPFKNRMDVPDFPKNLEWLNSKPLTKADLKGKFVLLDFWTYCCINCIHILPELKKLEKQFPNELVVIGVHSAKFDTEKLSENIRQAILRYEIVHPVINDAEHQIWDDIGVSSWPTILLIDPEGKAVWGRAGEFKGEEVAEILKVAIPYYRDQKLLDETPIKFELEAYKEEATPLRFPGKILADEKGNRLFISDSNHNRIVITTLDGQLLDVIGKGDIGRADGNYETATFDHPQGCALLDETLYIADTENHLLRKVNLRAKTVTTIAGTGKQAENAWPGLERARLTEQLPERWVGPPDTTGLNSPWALWIHMGDLYIAMAGPHQIWRMPLTEKEIGPYAGNGREDIVDGPLLPRVPYATGFSSFAQPSGLSSDGTWLYVADSEGSSIRAVPFDSKKNVRTVVGTDHLEFGRLFAFGDKDGPRRVAKLQHCLEVVYHEGKLYVADTYNHKIKVIDAKTGETKTFAGIKRPGNSDDPAQFHEPAGLAIANGTLYVADTNNHLIRTIDLKTRQVATMTIAGLAPPPSAGGKLADGNGETASAPATAAAPKKPSFKGAHAEKIAPVAVKPQDGVVKLQVSLKIPEGWKVNPLAPMSYWLDSPRDSGPADRAAFGRTKLSKPTAQFEIPVKIFGEGEDELNVSLNYFYCEEGDDGVCKVGAVVFTVPLTIAEDGAAGPVLLVHEIQE